LRSVSLPSACPALARVNIRRVSDLLTGSSVGPRTQERAKPQRLDNTPGHPIRTSDGAEPRLSKTLRPCTGVKIECQAGGCLSPKSDPLRTFPQHKELSISQRARLARDITRQEKVPFWHQQSS
jgi:hypothetical protein